MKALKILHYHYDNFSINKLFFDLFKCPLKCSCFRYRINYKGRYQKTPLAEIVYNSTIFFDNLLQIILNYYNKKYCFTIYYNKLQFFLYNFV